jgi:hypothetical protein
VAFAEVVDGCEIGVAEGVALGALVELALGKGRGTIGLIGVGAEVGLAEGDAVGLGLAKGLALGVGDGDGVGVDDGGLLTPTAADNVIVRVWVVVPLAASVIVIVTVKVPSTLGVPEILEPLNVRPAGKVPEDQVYGLVPPLPVSV